MEKIIRALLLADRGVFNVAGSRVNFGTHPQGEPLPALVLNTVSDFGGYLIDAPDGMFQARLQVDAYAMDYDSTKRLSRAARTALSGYSGSGIQGVFHVSSRDSREGGSNEAERPYRISLDFTITYANLGGHNGY